MLSLWWTAEPGSASSAVIWSLNLTAFSLKYAKMEKAVKAHISFTEIVQSTMAFSFYSLPITIHAYTHVVVHLPVILLIVTWCEMQDREGFLLQHLLQPDS